MVEIERAFGATLPLSTLLTQPTVAALARLLRAPPAELPPSVVLLRAGQGGPPVFFIHDGEGEVLPYRNLAMRLGRAHPVYGIAPKRQLDYPMLHSRLGDVVGYYTDRILEVAPRGPYLLGGLCIGGFLAFEIARRLQRLDRSVVMVGLIDVAHVKARPRSIAAARARRFSAALGSGGDLGHPERLLEALRASSRKLWNLAAYESRKQFTRLRNQARMRLFRVYLDQGWTLPPYLAHISVDVVLHFAEREYVLPEPYPGELLLFRATRKSPAFDGTLVDDTPYREMFEDEHLGWDGKASGGLVLHDVPAGHSSMLQEPHVALIAERMQSYIDAALAKGSG
jgi:thioesterase domain-containing protein